MTVNVLIEEEVWTTCLLFYEQRIFSISYHNKRVAKSITYSLPRDNLAKKPIQEKKEEEEETAVLRNDSRHRKHRNGRSIEYLFFLIDRRERWSLHADPILSSRRSKGVFPKEKSNVERWKRAAATTTRGRYKGRVSSSSSSSAFNPRIILAR